MRNVKKVPAQLWRIDPEDWASFNAPLNASTHHQVHPRKANKRTKRHQQSKSSGGKDEHSRSNIPLRTVIGCEMAKKLLKKTNQTTAATGPTLGNPNSRSFGFFLAARVSTFSSNISSHPIHASTCSPTHHPKFSPPRNQGYQGREAVELALLPRLSTPLLLQHTLKGSRPTMFLGVATLEEAWISPRAGRAFHISASRLALGWINRFVGVSWLAPVAVKKTAPVFL